MLMSSGVYIVEADPNMFVWVGKQSPMEERKAACTLVEDIVAGTANSAVTRVEREVQFGETALFKSLFYLWDPPRSFDFTNIPRGNVAEVCGRTRSSIRHTAYSPCRLVKGRMSVFKSSPRRSGKQDFT